MNTKKADVAVIGGGVIGAAVTYYLAKKGVKVVLIEKDDLLSGTSARASGGILLSSKMPGIHLQMAFRSAELYDDLTKETGTEVEYEKCGGMTIIETDDDMKVFTRFVKDQKKSGLSIELLNIDAARILEPALSRHILATTYCGLDREVNPLYLVFALVQGAKRRGADVCLFTKVRSILTKNKRIESVITDRGRIETSIVVNAAGIDAPAIGKMVGLNIPIKRVRGQEVVTERIPPLAKCAFMAAFSLKRKLSHFYQRYFSKLDSEKRQPFAAHQTNSGNFLLGTTYEEENTAQNTDTTIRGIKSIINNAVRLLPALKHVHVIRTFAGLRPYTSDGLPILGSVDEVEGFIMASGHGGDGIALAPITGNLITELIVDGKPSIPMKEFKLSRFANEERP